MQLELLGTGGFHPSRDRHTSCFVLPEAGVVLDAGTAVFRLADRLRTNDVDIFLSHAHLDHVVGLTYLIDVVRVRPQTRFRVHGSQDKLDAIERHLFSEALFPVAPPYDARPLVGEVATPGRRNRAAFCIRTSRRLTGIPHRLARSIDGVRYRHDRVR